MASMVQFHFLTDNYRTDISGDEQFWLVLWMGESESLCNLQEHTTPTGVN